MAWRIGIVAAAMVAVVAPATAQQFVSDSYTFMKAVRDRDGTKATEILDKPNASTVLATRDPATGELPLNVVVKRRDLTWTQFLIGKGAPLNARDDQGMTPVATAAQLGWVEGLTVLVQYGGSVDTPDNRGETPLILATQARSLATVTQLLAQGADPRQTDNAAGMSAIDYARRDGRSPEILRVLESAKPKAKRAVAGPSITGR